MSGEQMRDRFEAHMVKQNVCTSLARHRSNDTYRTISVQRAWELWQAALATQPQAPQYGNCTTMTFGSDCVINGIEVKAGTVVKVCAPTETPEVRK